MKKCLIIIATVISVLAVSCNEDDISKRLQDPIIGDWQIKSIVLAGTDGNLDTCEAKSLLQFMEDGSWRSVGFDQNQHSTGCAGNPIFIGVWQNNGDGSYLSSTESGTSETIMISFTDNQNTLITALGEEDQEVVVTYTRIVNQDLIIGTWNLVSVTLNGEPDPADACRARSMLEFLPNNVVVSIQYELNSEETECIIEEQTISGWENQNGIYMDTTNGANTPVDVAFSNNNNTLTFTFSVLLGDTTFMTTRVYDKAQ